MKKLSFLLGAIKSAGKKGFTETRKNLEGKPGIRNPSRLAGWLKSESKKRGLLSKEHAYGKRSK